MIILDGKQVAAQCKQRIRLQCEALAARGIKVGLAVILVGDDPASQVYVRNKVNACHEVGIESRLVKLPQDATNEQVLAEIEALNLDPTIHGMILQLPVPRQCDQHRLLAAIDPAKDADGLTVVQRGRMAMGLPCILPCTPKGVMTLLAAYHIDPQGKRAVVVGRSTLVGQPLADLLTHANATVTLCHSYTPNLPEICRQADILCVAVGKPHLICADMVKEGAVVVDIGTSKGKERLVGDVDFDAVAPKCSYISPVPGGVGPLTVSTLLQNTLDAYQMAHE